jgi:3-keto steroid reductase
LGIGQRLIDEFLTSRSLSEHLILIVTTRTLKKSRETITTLYDYMKESPNLSRLKSSKSDLHDVTQSTSRIHILSVELDLCDMRSIFGAADKLMNGLLANPVEPTNDSVQSGPFRIPRLDSVIFNAGYGGWNGIYWGTVIHQFFTAGFIVLTTWPAFMRDVPGLLVDPLKSVRPNVTSSSDEVMGEVFCANVFGHYVFAHALLPLLNRAADSRLSPGRIIWTGTLESVNDSLDMSDFQSLKKKPAYEGTKRLIDILALTSEFQAVRPYSDAWFQSDSIPATESAAKPTPTRRSTRQQQSQGPPNSKVPHVQRPKTYLTHPGIMATSLFPLNAFLGFFYPLALLLARWLGSPWHPITGYKGAIAPAYVALASQTELDDQNMERIKLGSATTRSGCELLKKTEVDGWGWEGKVEDRAAMSQDTATGVLRRAVGRHPKSKHLTKEGVEEFEVLSAEVWKEMEDLRIHWTRRYQELVSDAADGEHQ